MKSPFLKPCPFCGESLVEQSDQHGKWFAHKNEAGPCIASIFQVFPEDPKSVAEWNQRSEHLPLPRHLALTIQHNEHKSVYAPIEEWIKSNCETGCFSSDEDKQRCIESNEIWEIIWNPHTPVASYKVAASTLELALRLASEA